MDYKCEMCGKPIYPPDIKTWAFKKYKRVDKSHSNFAYFCKWGCMRKWEAAHAKEVVEVDE